MSALQGISAFQRAKKATRSGGRYPFQRKPFFDSVMIVGWSLWHPGTDPAQMRSWYSLRRSLGLIVYCWDGAPSSDPQLGHGGTDRQQKREIVLILDKSQISQCYMWCLGFTHWRVANRDVSGTECPSMRVKDRRRWAGSGAVSPKALGLGCCGKSSSMTDTDQKQQRLRGNWVPKQILKVLSLPAPVWPPIFFFLIFFSAYFITCALA